MKGGYIEGKDGFNELHRMWFTRKLNVVFGFRQDFNFYMLVLIGVLPIDPMAHYAKPAYVVCISTWLLYKLNNSSLSINFFGQTLSINLSRVILQFDAHTVCSLIEGENAFYMSLPRGDWVVSY